MPDLKGVYIQRSAVILSKCTQTIDGKIDISFKKINISFNNLSILII